MPVRLSVLVAGFCMSTPSVSFALGFCVTGNEAQPAANYEDWPGLIDVVNDPSRQLLCWVNGNESLWYRGDTRALNRVLAKFAEVQAPDLQVVLRPGPGLAKSLDGANVDVDWQVHVLGGIARQYIEWQQITAVHDVVPTLTVYLTDRLDLTAISIPRGIKVLQLEDKHRQYADGVSNGNTATKAAAKRLLEQLDSDAKREGDAAELFDKRVAAIREYARSLRRGAD